jgi:hypothetical protein
MTWVWIGLFCFACTALLTVWVYLSEIRGTNDEHDS